MKQGFEGGTSFFNRQETYRNIDEYKKALAGTRKGKGVLFLVRRGESALFLALEPQPEFCCYSVYE